MKIIKVTSIPPCDLCSSPDGIHDAPFVGTSWANQCESCFNANTNSLKGSGFLREIGVVTPVVKTDLPVLMGEDISDMEEVIYDEANREIECPECGDTREVEPDASYTYTCSCGRRVKCPAII